MSNESRRRVVIKAPSVHSLSINMAVSVLLVILSLSGRAIGGGARVLGVHDLNTRSDLFDGFSLGVVGGNDLLHADSRLRALLQAEATVGSPPNTLLAAAAGGNLAEVEQEISKGSDVNVVLNGNTPLMAAMVGKHFDVMKALIAAGADANVNLPSGQALILAAAMLPDNAKGLTILLDAGADVNTQVGGVLTPLLGAASLGLKSNMEVLLARGATFDRVFVDAVLCSCLAIPSGQLCNADVCKNKKDSLLALFD